jgi:hypothetical protein
MVHGKGGARGASTYSLVSETVKGVGYLTFLASHELMTGWRLTKTCQAGEKPVRLPHEDAKSPVASGIETPNDCRVGYRFIGFWPSGGRYWMFTDFFYDLSSPGGG